MTRSKTSPSLSLPYIYIYIYILLTLTLCYIYNILYVPIVKILSFDKTVYFDGDESATSVLPTRGCFILIGFFNKKKAKTTNCCISCNDCVSNDLKTFSNSNNPYEVLHMIPEISLLNCSSTMDSCCKFASKFKKRYRLRGYGLIKEEFVKHPTLTIDGAQMF